MKRKIILPSVLALAILASVLAPTSVTAQDYANYPPIVQKIAEQLDIDVDEVDYVFDEEYDEKRAEKFACFADRLDDLVLEGKLTEEQRDTILDKHEEMQDAMEELGDLSMDKRDEKMQSMTREFTDWLGKQGIDRVIEKVL